MYIQKGVQDGKWKAMLNKFSNYNRSITSFCKENILSKDRFYYYKNKFEKADDSIFQAVSIEKNIAIAKELSQNKDSKVIRIEIGKSAILIPSHEIYVQRIFDGYKEEVNLLKHYDFDSASLGTF